MRHKPYSTATSSEEYGLMGESHKYELQHREHEIRWVLVHAWHISNYATGGLEPGWNVYVKPHLPQY
jgi:hypothetical protein